MIDRVIPPESTSRIYSDVNLQNFEATSGHVISQVRDSARNSYGYKPNVVLVGDEMFTFDL